MVAASNADQRMGHSLPSQASGWQQSIEGNRTWEVGLNAKLAVPFGRRYPYPSDVLGYWRQLKL
jgi:hypothetical protein